MEMPEVDTHAIQSSPRTKPSLLDRFWPVISNDEEAEKAARSGAYAAAVVAVLTSAVSLIAIGAKSPVLGIDGWAFVDALLFALIAWRSFKFSLPWAVAGLLLYCTEMVWRWNKGGLRGGNVVVPCLITLALIAGVRGTAFLRKRAKRAPAIVAIQEDSE